MCLALAACILTACYGDYDYYGDYGEYGDYGDYGVYGGPEKKAQTRQETAITVKTDTLAVRSLPIVRSFFGEVRFKQSMQYAAESQGNIRELNIRSGQRVKKNQLLMAYPPAQHHLHVERVRIAFNELQDRYNRQLKLHEKKAVSRIALNELKAQLDIREKELSELQSIYVVKAPYSGVITDVKVHKGQQVAPGEHLFSIARIESIEVEFFVSEKHIRTITTGQQAQIFSGADTLIGTVSEKAFQMEPSRRAFKVKATCPNANGTALAGSTVQVALEIGTIKDAIIVSEESIIQQGGSQYVYLAINDRAAKREIHTGKRIGLQVHIQDGLQPGDVLITAGIAKLADSAFIEIIH